MFRPCVGKIGRKEKGLYFEYFFELEILFLYLVFYNTHKHLE